MLFLAINFDNEDLEKFLKLIEISLEKPLTGKLKRQFAENSHTSLKRNSINPPTKQAKKHSQCVFPIIIILFYGFGEIFSVFFVNSNFVFSKKKLNEI